MARRAGGLMDGAYPLELDCGPCVVREWEPADRPSLVSLANNRRVWLNLAHRFPHPYTGADADAWFGLLADMPRPTHWAIDVDGKAVGGIGIDIREGIHARNAMFGYWLGEPYWGRGIMTAAVRTTAEFVLDEFDLVRLESLVFEWNPASMRVLEKCGFQREGVMRKSVIKDGKIIDASMYARVR
ncbi:MAG TPA: GNAT family protein [Steroidobacteraceae bacterium]|nr:GNAT family protein [Steroidobacteraceae bacterium]